MKTLTIMIALVLYSSLSFGQGGSFVINARPTYEFNNENQQASSVVKTHYNADLSAMKYRGQYTDDKCASYHKMKVAGIILTAVGGGMFITGATLVAIDNQQTAYYGEKYNGPYHPLRNGGGAMMGVGFLSLGAGIPLTIVGCIKVKRYCDGVGSLENSRSYLELHSGSNGTGLALKF